MSEAGAASVPAGLQTQQAGAGSHESPVTGHPSTSLGASQSLPLVLPSVPVDQLLDDHAVEFEECKRAANSDASQAARMTKPAGCATVRAPAKANPRAT